MWPRSAKRIELPEQARAALGIEDAVLAPTEVIRAILRAPVDVLWNGGIGTVVKASTETDADAQDRSSDAIRVDAAELRCRVVAEGGNLGLTQRARIEFAARAAGCVNADFIDNSAGVDCSDHEVNLKVLLDLAVRRGELDADGRDALLARGHRRRRRARPLRLLPAGADPRAGGRAARPARMFAYEDLMAALEAEGLLRPRGRVPAHLRGDGRPPARRAAASSAPSSPCCSPTPSAALTGALLRVRRCPTTRTSRATCAATSRPPSSSASATCSPSTRCAASWWRRSSPTTSSTRSARRSSRGSSPSRAPSRPTSCAPTASRATSRAPSERWAADRAPRPAVDRQAQWTLHRRRRHARRGDGALVPRERPRGRPGHGDRRPGARGSGASRRCCPSSARRRRGARARGAPSSSSRACPRSWRARTPTCPRSRYAPDVDRRRGLGRAQRRGRRA